MNLAAAAGEIELLDYLVRGGFVVFLFVVLYGGYKGWWVYGPAHQRSLDNRDKLVAECKAETKEWKDLALNLLQTAKSATTTAETVVKESREGSNRAEGH